MNKPIGAWATIQFVDDNEPIEQNYISFGEYDDFEGKDSFGKSDLYIFFYCEGEEELKSLMTRGAEDFVVLDYELEYETEQENN